MDEIDEDKLNKAWNAIMNQYFSLCLKNSIDCGPGINMFFIKSRQKPEGCNCDYFYCQRDDEYWNLVMERLDESDKLQEVYHPDRHIIICLQLQHIDEGYDYGGTIRLFNKEKNEINIYKYKDDKINFVSTNLRKRF